MKIKQIVTQFRRDFIADYECEHCGTVIRKDGYDDANFHRNVIPSMPCPQCGQKAPANYRPLTTKYPEGVQV